MNERLKLSKIMLSRHKFGSLAGIYRPCPKRRQQLFGPFVSWVVIFNYQLIPIQHRMVSVSYYRVAVQIGSTYQRTSQTSKCGLKRLEILESEASSIPMRPCAYLVYRIRSKIIRLVCANLSYVILEFRCQLAWRASWISTKGLSITGYSVFPKEHFGEWKHRLTTHFLFYSLLLWAWYTLVMWCSLLK